MWKFRRGWLVCYSFAICRCGSLLYEFAVQVDGRHGDETSRRGCCKKTAKTVAANSGSSLDAHREGKAPAAGPLKDIYFDFDRYDLGGDARDMLKSHAQWLKENGASQIEIEGHCDDRGTDEYNLALGARPLKIIWSRWAYRPVGSRRSVTAKSCRCVANRPKSAGGEIVTTGSS